jgi:hypothetical protein
VSRRSNLCFLSQKAKLVYKYCIYSSIQQKIKTNSITMWRSTSGNVGVGRLVGFSGSRRLWLLVRLVRRPADEVSYVPICLLHGRRKMIRERKREGWSETLNFVTPTSGNRVAHDSWDRLCGPTTAASTNGSAGGTTTATTRTKTRGRRRRPHHALSAGRACSDPVRRDGRPSQAILSAHHMCHVVHHWSKHAKAKP